MPSRTTSAPVKAPPPAGSCRRPPSTHHVAGAQIDAQPIAVCITAGGGRLPRQAAAFCSLGVSQSCSSCAMSHPLYNAKRIHQHTHRRSRTKVRALVTPSPVGVVISQPSSARPARQCTARFDEMLVSMAFAIWFMRCRYCASASPPHGGNRLQAEPPGDGFFDVGDPHHRQYRHHHFSDGKRMAAGVSTKQQARLIRRSGRWLRNLARVTTDPVTADGAFCRAHQYSSVRPTAVRPGAAVSFTAC